MDVSGRASALAHPFLSQDFLAAERHTISDVCLPKAETWVWDAGGHVIGFISLLGSDVGGLFLSIHDTTAPGSGERYLSKHGPYDESSRSRCFQRSRSGGALYAALCFEVVHERVGRETGREVMRFRLAADESPRPKASDRR